MNPGETLSNNEPNNTTEWDSLSEVKMTESVPIQTETTPIQSETTPTQSETTPTQIETEPIQQVAPAVAETKSDNDISKLDIDTNTNRLKGAAYAVKTLESAVSGWQNRLDQAQSGGFFKRLLNRREINQLKHTLSERQKELDNARKSQARLMAILNQPQNPTSQPVQPQTPANEPPLEKAA